MKALLSLFMILTAFSNLLFNFAEAALAAEKTLDKSNLTILGLTIGDSTSQDIYSRLGPGIPFEDDLNPDITQVCYASDKDDTLILFFIEYSQCSRFRLILQKNKFHKWHFCEKSPLVSEHLATQSSIKLRMSKNRMKAILGAPQNESNENLSYFYEWKQKMNTAEMEGALQDSKDFKKNPFWTVSAIIRAKFSEAGLISFDVSKISQ